MRPWAAYHGTRLIVERLRSVQVEPAQRLVKPTKWAVLAVAILIGVWSGPSGAEVEEARVDTAQVDTARSVTSPRRAMLRSLALPGWGQFHNGRYIKGSIIAAAEVGSAVAFFVRRHQIGDDPEDGTRRRNLYLFTTLGIVFYSMVDAFVDAHLDGVDWGTVEVGKGEGGVEVRARVDLRF